MLPEALVNKALLLVFGDIADKGSKLSDYCTEDSLMVPYSQFQNLKDALGKAVGSLSGCPIPQGLTPPMSFITKLPASVLPLSCLLADIAK
eukprot:1160300-Pelagomonas_calceolata.AAC.1